MLGVLQSMISSGTGAPRPHRMRSPSCTLKLALRHLLCIMPCQAELRVTMCLSCRLSNLYPCRCRPVYDQPEDCSHMRKRTLRPCTLPSPHRMRARLQRESRLPKRNEGGDGGEGWREERTHTPKRGASPALHWQLLLRWGCLAEWRRERKEQSERRRATHLAASALACFCSGCSACSRFPQCRGDGGRDSGNVIEELSDAG